MNFKKVNASLSAQDMADVRQSIADARQMLDYLINLQPEERGKGLRLGEGSILFAQKTADYVARKPELFPSFHDLAAYTNEYQQWDFTLELRKLLQELLESVDDTLMAMGSHLMTKTLDVYANIKRATASTDIVGIDTIYADLQKRFARSSGIAIDEEGLGALPDHNHNTDGTITDNDIDGNVHDEGDNPMDDGEHASG